MSYRTAVAYVEAGSEVEPPAAFELVEVVVEHDPVARAGLGGALRRIAGGAAETLLLARLGAAAGSFAELLRLLEWLGQAGAELIALDVGLDTATAAGRASLTLLREIERWERRPRGRPGLAAVAPELSHRIAELRAQGLSLQRIADELNREGVPTPRGGSSWRPSSVQTVLGYRRPRPPVPRAPRPHGAPGPRAQRPPGPRPHSPLGPRPR